MGPFSDAGVPQIIGTNSMDAGAPGAGSFAQLYHQVIPGFVLVGRKALEGAEPAAMPRLQAVVVVPPLVVPLLVPVVVPPVVVPLVVPVVVPPVVVPPVVVPPVVVPPVVVPPV